MKLAALFSFLFLLFFHVVFVSAQELKQDADSAFHFYEVPTKHSYPGGIAVDSKGSVWFTQYRTNKLAIFTKAAYFKEYEVPTQGANPYDIAVDSNGNVWFVESGANQIGRFNPSQANLMSMKSRPKRASLQE